MLQHTAKDDDGSKESIFSIIHFEYAHVATKIEDSICRITDTCTAIILSGVGLVIGIYNRISFDVVFARTSQHHHFT